jgi:hypothetical protein
MTEPMSKTDWLAKIDQTQQTWESIVNEAGPERLDQPGAAGDWTLKDVAGHLNGWRARTVARLEAAARNDTEHPANLWPSDLSDETEEGTEAINAWLYEHYRDLPAEDILGEAREQFGRMRAAVEALSDEELNTPGRYPWLGDYPIAAVIEGSSEHLFEEHEPALREWLAKPSPHVS